MRNLLRVLVIALGIASPVAAFGANSWGADMSDLWWIPSESGWGANISHQREVIFMTLFVYGTDGRPTWYVAPAMTSPGSSGTVTFSGALYETAGPFFGGPFNASTITYNVVGSATLSFPNATQGNLTYSAYGSTVTKAIQRQTFRANLIGGGYIGAAVGRATGCGSSSGSYDLAAQFFLTMTESSLSVTMQLSNGRSCSFSGAYSQRGRMGNVSGAVSCDFGALRGTFEASQMESSEDGFLLKYRTDFGGGCTEYGRFGGLRRLLE